MKHIEIPYGAYFFGDKLNVDVADAFARTVMNRQETPDRIIYVNDPHQKSARLAQHLHRAFGEFSGKAPSLEEGTMRDTIYNAGAEIPTLLIVRPEIDLLEKLTLKPKNQSKASR